ncbi:hypothetical protein [Nitrosomonas supralitoralis]|uniref:Uncharacterized protein n=1 Tax=Nitrosomonas supralitoralis TaxID=2116706 RepID=A0A2P7NXL3_9PROT|nr:hypothetical protein [Nitrosomonas supralitoralis]PSJ18204.1 hypothetical protein C7H79_04085 [Nitrosomonas supralitoralis]
MADETDSLTQDKAETVQPATRQVSIRMLPGEQTGQPLYSNFSAVNGGQGVVLIDFGFLDPQNLNILKQATKSGEKLPDAINVKLSSRTAISIDAAHHLSQQLNQLLSAKPPSVVVQNHQDTTSSEIQADPDPKNDSLDTQKSDKGGFRFPWSKKNS